MIHELKASERITTSAIGDFCPYWTILDEKVMVADTAEEIISIFPEKKRIIDPVAVIGLLHFNYIPGNRTLIQGVQRMPWRATLRGDGFIKRHAPIPHANNYVGYREIAQNLQELLEEELYNAIQGYRRVFLLLSGGLDSRIIAGVIKKIEPQLNAQITCISWGFLNSRDVVYARKIAGWYNWGFFHIPYDCKLTWDNIKRGAVWGGSEVAGFNLHGLSWFRNAKPEDLVISGSFGNSLGRAEYNHRHLNDIKIEALSRNRMGLLHPSLPNGLVALIENDRQTAWEGTQREPDWVLNELNEQENYLRRELCHPKNYIRNFCNLYEAYTNNKVVSYIWSISPECRKKEVYYQLLKNLDSKLYSLPYARTGVAPDGTRELDLSLRVRYHEWWKWLRCELRPRLEPLFFSSGLRKLNLFYGLNMHLIWKKWLKEPMNKPGWGLIIAEICSIELSRQHFNIQPCSIKIYRRDIIADVFKRGLKKTRNCFLKTFK
ncbi:MAG: asparagine synthase-related protein [Candidatus Omnitrophica bacterium]|nr:asparagine synthase-related protein [Candidatus Omnitrophota bacterium]MDD5429304.1 asparagine synthase-related protein [Candidatus Omnitrophota bacterium]